MFHVILRGIITYNAPIISWHFKRDIAFLFRINNNFLSPSLLYIFIFLIFSSIFIHSQFIVRVKHKFYTTLFILIVFRWTCFALSRNISKNRHVKELLRKLSESCINFPVHLRKVSSYGFPLPRKSRFCSERRRTTPRLHTLD